MDVNAANSNQTGHGRMSPVRWDTSTQLATAVGVALLVAILLHIKFNASAGVRVGK